MSWIEKIVIWQYFLPMALATITVFFVERKSKLYPCDEEEVANRSATAFYGMIVFSFIQAIIRSQ